ncbi:MAG: hypothetical protein RRA92_05585, partial [Gemmatimonadota bacterium]|nr:hypothetical protein [Gemmatimonadota bacterium]
MGLGYGGHGRIVDSCGSCSPRRVLPVLVLGGILLGAPTALRAQVGSWEALERARGALTAGQVEAGERAYWSGCGAGVGEAAE